ncbi:hypothetical protein [Aquimarina algiphila]|uniref:Uncharacterized protein n=1 Tax=Aquimarina algiphila TaxID=2047982 RepID=A0A554VEG6_9FLAO|nr:hypothetical protein [Aquimarina algiphila]TSE05426.1 hypothetical protein FOF46_22955 [Aquimarina algiphila]
MDSVQDQLLDRIITAIKSLGLTGYEIGEKTPLSQVGVDKILNRTSSKPRETTVNTLKDLLSKEYKISKSWLDNGTGDMKVEREVVEKNSLDIVFQDMIGKVVGNKLDEIISYLEIIMRQNNEIKEYIDTQRVKDLVSVEKKRVIKKEKKKTD